MNNEHTPGGALWAYKQLEIERKEAADTIEALRAENARLEGLKEAAVVATNKAMEERVRLRKELRKEQEALLTVVDQREALRAENARLQAELAEYKRNGIIVASDYRALQVENGRLLQLLDEALEGYEDCISYKSEYLVEKHGDKEEVARIRAALGETE